MPDSSYSNPSRLLPWFSAGLFRQHRSRGRRPRIVQGQGSAASLPSMTAPKLSFEVHHRPGERPCPGHRAEASSVVGLKGPPRRTELALFPNLVSWLARMNARREFPSNSVGARCGAGQKRLDRIRWPHLQMKNPGGLTLKARNKGRNMTGHWVKLTTERGFSSLDHGACTLTYRYAKP
jgi:hypothetical protein